jgi:hypothetical protein
MGSRSARVSLRQYSAHRDDALDLYEALPPEKEIQVPPSVFEENGLLGGRLLKNPESATEANIAWIIRFALGGNRSAYDHLKALASHHEIAEKGLDFVNREYGRWRLEIHLEEDQISKNQI